MKRRMLSFRASSDVCGPVSSRVTIKGIQVVAKRRPLNKLWQQRVTSRRSCFRLREEGFASTNR